jgi:hypothetical protein
MKLRMILSSLLVLAVFPAMAADDAKQIVKQGDWEAYANSNKNNKLCYAASMVKKKTGDVPGRKAAYLMITHGPGAKSANVVSINSGYLFKSGSEVEVEIGNAKFKMFVKGDTAWAFKETDDRAIIQAMAKGTALIVKGTPDKGKPTVDTYSLSGFGVAYAEINKACGIR